MSTVRLAPRPPLRTANMILKPEREHVTCVSVDLLSCLPQALVRLPPKLSDDEFVLNFFELRPEDLEDPS